MIAGGLTLAVLVLPIMIITTPEALRAVPGALREASWGSAPPNGRRSAIKCCRWRCPRCSPGSVLTVARAFGESAPLLLAGALVTKFFSVSGGRQFVDLVTRSPTRPCP